MLFCNMAVPKWISVKYGSRVGLRRVSPFRYAFIILYWSWKGKYRSRAVVRIGRFPHCPKLRRVSSGIMCIIKYECIMLIQKVLQLRVQYFFFLQAIHLFLLLYRIGSYPFLLSFRRRNEFFSPDPSIFCFMRFSAYPLCSHGYILMHVKYIIILCTTRAW